MEVGDVVDSGESKSLLRMRKSYESPSVPGIQGLHRRSRENRSCSTSLILLTYHIESPSLRGRDVEG